MLLIKLTHSLGLSFILDTNDLNCVNHFNKEGMEELKNSDKAVPRPIPADVVSQFKEIEKLVNVA